MVELLLRAGAKVNAQDRCGCTALASACCPLSFQPFRQQFLTVSPATATVEQPARSSSATSNAARKAVVKWDDKVKGGSKSATPKSRQAVIELLIASNADPDLKDQAGLTPLMVATIASEHLVVRTLLSANITRDACDDNGMTALARTLPLPLTLTLSFALILTLTPCQPYSPPQPSPRHDSARPRYLQGL